MFRVNYTSLLLHFVNQIVVDVAVTVAEVELVCETINVRIMCHDTNSQKSIGWSTLDID